MKKVFSAFLLILLAFVYCGNSIITAAGLYQPETFNSENESKKEQAPQKPSPRPPKGGHGKKAPPRYGNATPAPLQLSEAKAKAAYLMDYGSGKMLFAQNENSRYPIASMCKIMSLLLIYENMDAGSFKEDGQITVSENASGMGGSQVFLETNGTYIISDLIKSIVVASANDATVAMAELISGSEEGFVLLMNSRAKELGMNNTNFVNCTGLPQPGQYSSAKDCAIMLAELLNHQAYYKYSRIWMDKIPHSEGRVTEISNTNKLIRFYKGCDGGKTGFTSEAKHCISATAERNGMRLISVIIGAENSKSRFYEASRLLNHGFANYTSRQLVYSDTPLELKIAVKGGKEKTLEIAAQENYFVLTGKTEKLNYSIDYNIPDKISAPIKKGDVIGTLSVIIDSEVVKEINVLAASDIAKNTYGDCINDILNNW